MGKRLMDIAGSAIGLALLIPVFAVIAVAVVMDSGKPVLFSQMRVGAALVDHSAFGNFGQWIRAG